MFLRIVGRLTLSGIPGTVRQPLDERMTALLADKGGASTAPHAVDLIPLSVDVVFAGAALNHIFGADRIITSFKLCFAGTK